MLPAWVSEPPPAERYAEHAGEDRHERHRRYGREGRGRGPQRKRPTPNFQRPTSKPEGPRREFDRPSSKAKRPERPGRRDRRPPRPHDHRHRQDRHHGPNRQSGSDKPLPAIAVRFLPRAAALENVVEQIKSGTVAYSLFSLARLFLEKAPRHDVKLIAPPDVSLFQLGEHGAISADRHFLERNAFRFGQGDFYKIDVTEAEPIKGNFTNVARDRLSGTLLGPTNHHDYQRRLRNLYEQRFSRRMSFADYQRQIEIVNDPAAVEQWKEEARKVTTFTTLREETPATFASAVEAERHFRQHYLPGLIRIAPEIAIDGVLSRRLPDRGLHRAIEDAWTLETRSPSKMMQELAGRFREAGLNIFRYRRGMLFVSPIRVRPLVQESAAVSSAVSAILEALRATPGINRKELAEKLIVDLAGEELERAKLALASDLHWLVGEGYVIEFNDGSLDLPRTKAKAKPAVEAAVPAANETSTQVEIVQPAVSLADAEIGGS